MTDFNKVELLAPAGSYEAFEAALGAGADAVYLGGPDFGARAYAKNFTQEELIRAIRTAHLHGRKLYLTVNTLLKNRELQERLYASLKPAYEEGLDAVIVQDMGVLRFIRRVFPDLPIHASTQMAVTGAEGMQFLESLGVARVVPARELSLEELKIMHRESSIEIETFIHGALCYSISGQCLMSSILGGRSGNRGRCAQPCRLPYQIKEKQSRFSGDRELCPLSLKDICTLDILPEILDAGVTSLKIEGRMKQPEYTAAVTGIYRKYLDILKNNNKNYQVAEEDRRFLLDVFNRGGSCQGYYKQHNGSDMMAFHNHKKGTGTLSVFTSSPKEKINGSLLLFPESPAILQVSCGDIQTVVSMGEVQYAKDRPMEESRIRQQMEKLGNTEFTWKNLDIQMGENIFLPVRLLNELRRAALCSLEEEILKKYKRAPREETAYESEISSKRSVRPKECSPVFYASCETREQAEAVMACKEIKGVYLPFYLMNEFMEQGRYKEKELFLSLPRVARGAVPKGYTHQIKTWLSQGMKGFLVRNLESYGMLRRLGLQKYCVADASLYTWNDEACAFWKEEGILKNTAPVELNEKELSHRNNNDSEFLIYGYLPLMLSAQCVRKNTLKCDKKESQTILKDRYDKEFTSVCVCNPWKTGTTEQNPYCYNIIYNSLPYGLQKERDAVKTLGMSSLRLSFTMESREETEKILQEFTDVYFYGKPAFGREFTKGHFKRGAE
nr:U32 family peptidase [uncultured Blautia sp.]